MRGKIFTPGEVNEMLPLVSRIAEDIVATYGRLNECLREIDFLEKRAETDPFLQARLVLQNREADKIVQEFDELNKEIEDLGGTVRDYEFGMIDFYGDLGGAIVYLCWALGEEAVTNWHWLEEDFGSRKSIPSVHVV